MIVIASFVFWCSLALLIFVYAGFPLLTLVVGRILNRLVHQRPMTPTLSLLIAAYNEEAEIAARLANALAADYPREALEIVVASDGSTDETEAIAARYADRGVRLLRLPRRGKISALTDAVKHASGEILVFSDANTEVAPGALLALARNFADPEVGGVVGHTGYRLDSAGDSSGRGEDLYWRYDTWLKGKESRTGSVVSAHGGLYALRKELFCAPPESGVTDDFFISTCAVAQGKRLVFEPDARAWETAVSQTGSEFRRRVRLMTRGLRAVALRRDLLNPFRYGFYSLVLFSHKVLRRLQPALLLLLLASSSYLSGRGGGYLAVTMAQLLFYGLALAGYAARGTRAGHWKGFYIPFFYCMANAAALFALVNFLRGERIELWQPQRHAASAA